MDNDNSGKEAGKRASSGMGGGDVVMELDTSAGTQEIEINPEQMPGFFVTIRYCDPEKMRSLQQQAQDRTAQRHGRRAGAGIDNDILQRMLIDYVVVDWRGLKSKYVINAIALKPESRASLEAVEEIEYTTERARFMANNAPDAYFAGPVITTTTDWSAWKQRLEP